MNIDVKKTSTKIPGKTGESARSAILEFINLHRDLGSMVRIEVRGAPSALPESSYQGLRKRATELLAGHQDVSKIEVSIRANEHRLDNERGNIFVTIYHREFEEAAQVSIIAVVVNQLGLDKTRFGRWLIKKTTPAGALAPVSRQEALDTLERALEEGLKEFKQKAPGQSVHGVSVEVRDAQLEKLLDDVLSDTKEFSDWVAKELTDRDIAVPAPLWYDYTLDLPTGAAPTRVMGDSDILMSFSTSATPPSGARSQKPESAETPEPDKGARQSAASGEATQLPAGQSFLRAAKDVYCELTLLSGNGKPFARPYAIPLHKLPAAISRTELKQTKLAADFPELLMSLSSSVVLTVNYTGSAWVLSSSKHATSGRAVYYVRKGRDDVMPILGEVIVKLDTVQIVLNAPEGVQGHGGEIVLPIEARLTAQARDAAADHTFMPKL